MFRFFRIVRRRVRRRAPNGSVRYKKYKEQARSLVHARLAHYNAHYGFNIGKVFIKNHRGRWGSCSSRGNLNFNYKIVFLPAHLADYIVVHELCHLGQLNHSKDFWALVAQTMPDYKKRRVELKKGVVI